MGSGGSFVAILLSVPLTAVALVGVVGVPKLQEMLSSSSSSHDEDDFDIDDFDSRPRSKRTPAKSSRGRTDADPWSAEADLEDDLLDDFGSKPKSVKGRSTLTRNSRPKSLDAAADSELLDDSGDDFFSKPGRSRFGQNPREPEAVDMVSSEPFKSRTGVTTADHQTPAPGTRSAPPTNSSARVDGFAAAVEKLRAMGGDRFHLEPGLAAGQFLFVCQMASSDQSGTIHRFEAESSDPAAAVADVLQQISAWQSESSVTKTAGTDFRR